MAAGRIGETLEVPAATLSFHLKELARAGLVSSRQERQFIYYAVDFERVAELMTFLTENCCRGMPEKCLTVVETDLGHCCTPKLKPKQKRNQVYEAFWCACLCKRSGCKCSVLLNCVRNATDGPQRGLCEMDGGRSTGQFRDFEARTKTRCRSSRDTD